MKAKGKKLLAGILAAMMMISSVPLEAAAAEEGGTYASEEVITKVSALSNDRTQLFNEGWKFYQGNPGTAQNVEFDDSAWETVNLPHDFSIDEAFSTSYEAESGFLPGGTGWYRKAFVMTKEQEGKAVLLDFDGVYNSTEVYVNGTRVGNHVYGYTPFAYDISTYLKYDGTENVIAVKAVHQYPSSRWYSGSGIYRNVYLTVTDAVHVNHNGTKITTPNLESQKNGDVTVNIETKVKNDGVAEKQVTVKNTIYTIDGEIVSSAVSSSKRAAGKSVTSVSQSTKVNRPELWSVDHPVLYKAVTEVTTADTKDVYETQFGFKYYAFSKKTGFSLNGEKIKLKGVCMHHDQGALGAAAHYDAIARQLDILKKMGCNMIRVTHNPASRDFISLCDKKGILVIEEAFDTWTNPKNGNSYDYSRNFANIMDTNENMCGYESGMTWAEFDIKSMADRDKNSPCIILWSVGNEVLEGINGSVSNYSSIAKNLVGWLKEVDDSHPVTFGDNKLKDGNGTANAIADVIHAAGGVVGLNYSSDYQYDNINNSHGWILMGSETASAINSRGYYKTDSYSKDNASRELTAYDTSAVSWGRTANSSWQSVIARDAIAGEAVWTGFDYIGEPTPWNGTSSGNTSGYGASPNSSYFGIIDTAGFPKDTYYYYQSQWNDKVNTLHIVPGSWNQSDLKINSGKVRVDVYSDAPYVELFLNGKSLGMKSFTESKTAAGFTYRLCNNLTYMSWQVTYQSGTLKAVAYDKNKNVISDTVGTAVVNTSGTAAKITASADKTEMDADGRSLSYITLDITDNNGNPVNSASNKISVTLSGNGEIAGVDNGNAAETEKFQTPISNDRKSVQISAYHGKALVIVRAGTYPDQLVLNASADGLKSANTSVKTNRVSDTDSVDSYTMVREYMTVQGAKPVFKTTASVTLRNGTIMAGNVTWEEVPENVYNTIGMYTVAGILKYDGGELKVSARLKIAAQVAAIKNYSTATPAGTVPKLPLSRPGLMENGTESGSFDVSWNMPSADAFAKVGDIVEVSGYAEVLGEKMPVTARVRVVIDTKSENIAVKASAGSDRYAYDNPELAVDGINNKKGYTSWTPNNNYSTASLWLSWDKESMFDYALLYLRNDEVSANSVLPTAIDVYTSENAAKPAQTITSGYQAGKAFRIDLKNVKSKYIRLTFHCPIGKWIMVDEVEVYNLAESQYSSAELLSFEAGETKVAAEAGIFEYLVKVTDEEQMNVKNIAAKENAAYTVLPKMSDNRQYIVAESEDDSLTQCYLINYEQEEMTDPDEKPEIGVLEKAFLRAEKTELSVGETTTLSLYDVILSDGTDATYTCNAEIGIVSGEALLNGYELTAIKAGKVVVRAEVSLNGVFVTTNDVVITVKGTGETADMTKLAALVEETTEYVSVYAQRRYTAKSYDEIREARKEAYHLINSGDVTQKEADAAYDRLFAAKEGLVLRARPNPEIMIEKKNDKLLLTGTVKELVADPDETMEIVEHGIIYITQAKLGPKALTVDTSGRVKLKFGSQKDDGSFSYELQPASDTTRYAFAAYVRYYTEDGILFYRYSPVTKVALSDF